MFNIIYRHRKEGLSKLGFIHKDHTSTLITHVGGRWENLSYLHSESCLEDKEKKIPYPSPQRPVQSRHWESSSRYNSNRSNPVLRYLSILRDLLTLIITGIFTYVRVSYFQATSTVKLVWHIKDSSALPPEMRLGELQPVILASKSSPFYRFSEKWEVLLPCLQVM